ncbi:MAG TPA: MotA/TolQ/ExbB proton channel family protein [Planctomycetota bacterium]|nr:MotA/TolQ/ExbB proton channel family protein [Planctomycetota bacterium]
MALCLALPLAAQEPPTPVPGGDPIPLLPEKKAKSLILGEDSTVWDIFLRGGWCMWPILGCSIVGLVFFFERTVELRRKKHAPPGFDKDVVHLVDTRGVDAALALCLEKQSSLSRVLYAALLRYGTSRQEMEAAVQDEGARLLYDLRRNCRWIAIMANMAPLWGLLGTVLGLIECFDTISGTGGLGKAEALATGVAVALLTTAFGLIVAIPLLTMYHYNKNNADDIVREISERAVDSIVTLDRKARRSIRLIEDIEEHLETQEMAAARTPSPDLDLEIDEQGSALKSSVTTPPQIPVVGAEGRKGSSHELNKAGSSAGGPGVGRKEGSSSDHRAEKHP